MADILVRDATPDDADALSVMIVTSIRCTNSRDYPAEEIDQICADFSRERIHEEMKRRVMLIAESNGLLAGTISLGDDKLHSLFVHPELQGRGIAKHLVALVEDRARAEGRERLALSSSLTAAPFYESLGYERDVFENRAFGATWLMSKALRTTS